MSSFILLSAKGVVKQAKFIDLNDGVEASLGKVLKRAKGPVLIGSWTWQKYKLFLYGYKEGRGGTENKNELASPYDEEVLFGDACVVASLEKSAAKPADFSVDLYKKFYNSKFSQEEEEEDELDDEEDDEEEDLEDYEDIDEEEADETEELGGEDEEEEAEGLKPVLMVKPSTGFKKIAKWMHQPELQAEPYLL
jgi:hypothetical protein